MNDLYLEFDENSDVIYSLQMTLIALEKVKQDNLYWKWVIIALHNAVQGAMVCHLSGTANLGACTIKCVDKWMSWHDAGRVGEEPERKLAAPKELLERLTNDNKRIEGTVGASIPITGEQFFTFQLLCKLRNSFVHFQPKTWLIEIEGLPNLTQQNIKLVVKIFEHGWAFRHLKDNEKTLLKNLLNELGGYEKI